ncbi:MAG: biotin--[acetyl-CoA-carboxylase] ligase [Paenibacillaceae bacterium]
MNDLIVQYFMNRPDQFISGEQLSQFLNCSRTAVWKHIQELKKLGYRFESIPRKGYKLTQKPDFYHVVELIAACSSSELGRHIHLYDKLESTQTEAHRLVANGSGHGTLVIAERQTSGRGRMGRPWHSPAGLGIWMSLVITPQLALPFASQITLLTAVVLCRTIRKNYQVDIGIKWPNDLLIQARKVSGILVESSGEDERIRYMVIGVGIGCNMETEDYPAELRGIATSLSMETGVRIDRTQLIASFLEQFEELYKLYLEQGFAPIRILWESLSVSMHKPIRILSGGDWKEGVALGIDEMGALIVRQSNGEALHVYSGETIIDAGETNI